MKTFIVRLKVIIYNTFQSPMYLKDFLILLQIIKNTNPIPVKSCCNLKNPKKHESYIYQGIHPFYYLQFPSPNIFCNRVCN